MCVQRDRPRAHPHSKVSAQLELREVDDDDTDMLQSSHAGHIQGAMRSRCSVAAALLTILVGIAMILGSILDGPIAFLALNPVSAPSAPPPGPRPPSAPVQLQLIIDTDMAFDVDDVGAVCVAHALADLGEVDILAVVHDAGLFEGIGAVGALNTFYGRPQIQLGAFKGRFGANVAGPYVRNLASRFPSPVAKGSDHP